MRLFQFGLWIVVVAMGCKREPVPSAGALRVELSYATFRPGCLTVKAEDKADPSRSTLQQLQLGDRPERSRDLTVAVFRKEGWSRELVLTATAYERSCAEQDPRQVDAQTVEAVVPEEGILPVKMDLRAEDLDDDRYVKKSQGGSDCNDDDPGVNPDATEDCDGQDDNCNSITDDRFDAGTACTTALGCAGVFACTTGGTSSECVSTQQPTGWYVDEDGDQRAGTVAGMGCQPPVAGAVNRQDDCDDSSPFAFDGGTERCDRLDNDCNGQVDEGNCGAVSWQPIPGAGTSATEWKAVAAHAEGKAWVAGSGNALAHVEGGVATVYTDCSGNWVSAWARPSDGRVFLGSDDGVIATRAVTGSTGCQTANTGRADSINGMVGFESGGSTILFAATSDGRVYRWTYPGAQPPVEVTQVAANLRDVHGTSPTNLLAVGAEEVSGNDEPRAFHSNPDGGTWIRENLPTPLPSDVFLRGVHMVHGQLAYAAGDNGVLFERSNGSWTALPQLVLGDGGTPDILGMAAYGRTSVYAVTNDKTVYLFNGAIWIPVGTVTWTPFAIDGVGPHDLWVAGSQGQVLHWGP